MLGRCSSERRHQRARPRLVVGDPPGLLRRRLGLAEARQIGRVDGALPRERVDDRADRLDPRAPAVQDEHVGAVADAPVTGTDPVDVDELIHGQTPPRRRARSMLIDDSAALPEYGFR